MTDNVDDFTPLTSPDHWLGWLGDDPAQAVRAAFVESLRHQVPTAKVPWMHITDTPHFLTGGRRDPSDDNKVIVTRAGLAVSFQAEVDDGYQVRPLRGCFSWVAAGLDGGEGARADQVFLDIGGTLSEVSEALQQRIYEVGGES